jgi:esterase/lipase superfamily enzyme
MRREIGLLAIGLAVACAGLLNVTGCGSQTPPPEQAAPKPAAIAAAKPTPLVPAASTVVPPDSVSGARTGPTELRERESLRVSSDIEFRAARAPAASMRDLAPSPPPTTGALPGGGGAASPVGTDAALSPAVPSPAAAVPESATDYSVMTVYYATDRQAIANSDARRRGYAGWFHLTVVVAGLTIFVAAVSLRYHRSRSFRLLNWMGMTLTVLLGTATTLARLRSEELDPGNHVGYGNARGDVQYGTCDVSIPNYHQVGKVERPSILRLSFREDPRKHVVLLDVEPEPAEAFYDGLKAKIAGSHNQEALVFVHGYNVTFEAAARRTAQLAYDLKFDGAAIFFSWPSQGGVLKYAVDETNVVWAAPHLKDFLVAVARQSGAKSVHLIAHSMGNRALTSALAAVAAEARDSAPMFREVVLTAPDIDADVFKRDIAPAIRRTAQRVTLYASSNDEALALSKKLHGYPRAGDSGAELIVVDGLDTIDVSNVDTSLLGHSYYGSNDTVLADLFYVLTEPRPARDRRWLEAVPFGRLSYWIFQRGGAGPRTTTVRGSAIR